MSSLTVPQKIEQHFSQYRLRKYSKGQIIIHAGDEPQYVYYLTQGKVRQYDISYRGDEIVVNVFKHGAFFSLHPIVTELPNRYFFECETEVEAYVAPALETTEFLKSNPDVLYDLLTRIYVGLDGILGRMFHTMSGSAYSRVLYELIIECQRFGQDQKDGSTFIAIHESDLAAQAGLSRETVSREMHKLKEQNLVRIGSKGISVMSLSSLQNMLGTDT